MKIPFLSGDYVNVFRPSGQTYPGPDGLELHHGLYYEEWVPNDHAFIRDGGGNWHIFGITHPLTSVANVHEGEVQLFHAKAPADAFDRIAPGIFRDLGCILPPAERSGEPEEIHSPAIVELGGVYQMIYGPTQFRLAQSRNLEHWELKGELFRDDAGASRDPQIMEHDGRFLLCYCSGYEVKMCQSPDLCNWSRPETILRLPEGVCPESPFLMSHDGIFYLFVCTWQGKNWDHKTISDAYQHQTLVFAADRIEDLAGTEPVTVLDAHAPEIVRCNGRYCISSAEWPYRGINLAPLAFEA